MSCRPVQATSGVTCQLWSSGLTIVVSAEGRVHLGAGALELVGAAEPVAVPLGDPGHLLLADVVRADQPAAGAASADVEPDDLAKTLTIKVRHLANPARDKAVAAIGHDLTKQASCHPETGARTIDALG